MMNAGGTILWAELLDERERERGKEWNMSFPRSLLPDGGRNVSSCITLLRLLFCLSTEERNEYTVYGSAWLLE